MPKGKMEYKSFTFKIEKQAEENGFLTFSGYASTFGNVDLDGDTILQGAFVASLEKEIPKMLLMHNSRAVPIGVWVSLKEDAIGLKVEGSMPLDDDRVKGMIAPQMRIKSLDAMSIGFRNAVFDFDQEHTNSWGDPGKIFKKVDLKEISLVTFPANEQARITAVKHYLEDDTFKDEIIQLLKTEIKTETKSTLWESLPMSMANFDVIGLTIDKHHLIENDDGKFMPIAGEVDGVVKAIPAGVISAAVQLEKDNFPLSEEKREELKGVISKYYELMGLEKPFTEESKWSLPEIKTLGKSDLEFVIRTGKLSRKSSDYIASVVLSAQDKKKDTHAEDSKSLDQLIELSNNAVKSLTIDEE